jgi:hypothetical protein
MVTTQASGNSTKVLNPETMRTSCLENSELTGSEGMQETDGVQE